MDPLDLVAGIDHDCFRGQLIANNGAVALQRPEGKGLNDHELNFTRCSRKAPSFPAGTESAAARCSPSSSGTKTRVLVFENQVCAFPKASRRSGTECELSPARMGASSRSRPWDSL